MLRSVLPIFSSKSFIVAGLIFMSLIHFEFIALHGVRKCSNFIPFHVPIQCSQHHLLKRLSFLHCIFLLPRLIGHKCMGLFMGFLCCSIGLCFSLFVLVPYCFDDCSFVVKSEVEKPDSSSSMFLSQDYFCYLWYFVFPYKFKIFLF